MEVEKIKSSIFKLGVYPALTVLREMQDNEQYEECAVIKQALDEIIKGREWYLSTNVDDESLEINYKNILSGTNSPEIIQNNMPYYIDQFRELIKS